MIRELERRARRQPAPRIYLGGDCGACVLAGLLDSEPEAIYEFLGKTEPLSWPGMSEALWRYFAHDYIDRLISDVPRWPVHDSQSQFGSPSWQQNLAWFRYVLMAIDGGYYGIASVDLDHKPGRWDCDHWVMICGARTYEEQEKRVIRQELLISCSARHSDGMWVDHWEFLRDWGGFNLLLARPKEKN